MWRTLLPEKCSSCSPSCRTLFQTPSLLSLALSALVSPSLAVYRALSLPSPLYWPSPLFVSSLSLSLSPSLSGPLFPSLLFPLLCMTLSFPLYLEVHSTLYLAFSLLTSYLAILKYCWVLNHWADCCLFLTISSLLLDQWAAWLWWDSSSTSRFLFA